MTSFLSSFGALWLLVEIGGFFSTDFATRVRGSGLLFLFVGVGLMLWQCWPLLRMECKLSGRDVCLEIRVGDFFKTPGTLIIGTNTTFDTKISTAIISEHSLQGQFTRRFFADEDALDIQLANALQDVRPTRLTGVRVGKRDQYPIGTTVAVDAKGVRSFWVAITHLNEHGTAVTSPDQLKEALANLWVHIGDHGTRDTLVVPALASRYGQMTLSREAIVRIIIQSFVAACAERTFCERLVIVLSGFDVTRHKVDLVGLQDYLRHLCRYSNADAGTSQPTGTAVA